MVLKSFLYSFSSYLPVIRRHLQITSFSADIICMCTFRIFALKYVQSPHISQSAIHGKVSLIYCLLSSSVEDAISGGLILHLLYQTGVASVFFIDLAQFLLAIDVWLVKCINRTAA